jgi:hypothetical protein
MALRNEDYVAFMDESGEWGKTDLQIVSGVLIPARWLRGSERRWRDFVRHQLGSQSGKTEIHAQDLLNGRGSAAYYASKTSIARTGQARSAKAAGRLLYRDALEHIAGIREVRILSVGLKTRYPREAYLLWFWLMFAALITRPRAPRPRLPLVVIDGQDDSLREAHDLIAHRFYSNFWGRQPYIQRGTPWFIGGSVQHRSEFLPFIQMADVVANAARQAIAGRKPYRFMYEAHLRQHAASLGPGRDIDISAHALAELKRRSPTDKCGSGYANALIVP